MPADQLAVFGKRYVAFDHAGAHSRCGGVGFPAVLGKLHRRAAVADREIALVERPGALAELFLEWAVLHLVDEVERARADLGFAGQGDALRRGGDDGRKYREREPREQTVADRHEWRPRG